MAVIGLRGTGDWAADERPKSFGDTILFRNPNGQAPLTALTSKMKKKTTTDSEFSWWEEELKPLRLQVTTAVVTAGTTIAVDLGDAEELSVGDVLLVEKTEDSLYTNELIEVASIASSTSFTVTRGAAGSTAATIPDDAFLTRIGNAFAEGTGAPAETTRNPTKVKNYAQIFKITYGLTGTAEQTETRTGNPISNDKKRKMFDLSAMMEFAFLFGKAYETTGSNGKPKRYTGGLREFIKTNVKIWTTTPTEDELLDAVYKVWDYGTSEAGDERLVFAGNVFLNSLNKLARSSTSSRVNFDGVVKIYGMNLQRWILPQGVLYVRSHPLLNVHGRYSASAFVIDPSNIIYRPLQNRDVKFKDNIQLPDADARKGQWIGEVGIEVHHERTMAYLGNFVK